MQDNVDQLDPQRLITRLTEQRDLYRRLQELSQRQRALISSDRPEMLLNILKDRQALVASLAQLNERLGPFRRGWESLYAQLPGDVRNQATTLLDEINGLLHHILKTDQEDSALLSARKQMAASALGDVASGRTVNAAYAGRPDAGAARGSADLSG